MSLLAPSGYAFNNIIDLLLYKKLQKKEIVVVGYGWAGKSFCDNIDKDKYNITVVSKTDYMLNTTKLKNSIINSIDPKLIIKPNFNKINFIQDNLKNINSNNIETTNTNISFDYLIIAYGSDTNDFNIKGVKENCYFLKEISDLYKLKESLEKNSNQQVIILGGGPNGIELAFELSKKYKNIKIIEAMSDILPNFTNETRTIVKTELKKNNINLILNNKVNKIEKNMIYSKENNLDILFFYDIAIWTCGIKKK